MNAVKKDRYSLSVFLYSPGGVWVGECFFSWLDWRALSMA